MPGVCDLDVCDQDVCDPDVCALDVCDLDVCDHLFVTKTFVTILNFGVSWHLAIISRVQEHLVIWNPLALSREESNSYFQEYRHNAYVVHSK